MAVMRREPPILLISVDSFKSHHHYFTWSTSVLIVGRFINCVQKTATLLFYYLYPPDIHHDIGVAPRVVSLRLLRLFLQFASWAKAKPNTSFAWSNGCVAATGLIEYSPTRPGLANPTRYRDPPPTAKAEHRLADKVGAASEIDGRRAVKCARADQLLIEDGPDISSMLARERSS